MGLPDYQPFRAPRDEIHDPWFARMSNPEDSPRYWRKWLQARGISDAIERQVSQHYRSLRRSFERMWTITYAGTVTGALLGVIVSVLCARAFTAATLPWVGILLLALGAPLLASLLWWGVYLTARRRQGRSQSGLVPGQELDSGDQWVDRILETVAEGLAKSESGPRDTAVLADHLTHATILMGVREAPTGELERQLLERLAGSAFVPALDGCIFVFKPGKPCSRCQARTRTGPLRLLNVPAHWAASNGYQRLKELPHGGRSLLVATQRMPELATFLGMSGEDASRPSRMSPGAEVFLCDSCADEAIRRGLLRPRASMPG